MSMQPSSAPTTAPEPALSPEKQRRLAFLQEYTARTNFALSVLALIYLITYTVQSIWYRPEQPWYQWLVIFGNALWVLFAVDLMFRFAIAPRKRHFFRENWLDTITVAFPQLRALRALRAFTPNGIVAREHSRGVITGGAAASAFTGTLILIWVGSLMVLNAERGAPGAEITSMGDSIWWAFETVTTVGYGDFVPVTWTGRIVAVAIMIVGISALGVVTATLSATLVKSRGSSATTPDATDPTAATPATTPPATTPPATAAPASRTDASDDDLRRELAEIKAMLADIQARMPATPAS